MESFLNFLRRIIPTPIYRTLQPGYHWLLAFLAAVVYGFPSRQLTVIGVTGTDGKTTVVHLLHEILAAAGHRVGSLSSLRFKIIEREEVNYLKMTMPGRFRLEKFLAECRAAGCRYVILEVTSHGIAQSRHRFIRFQAAVLTNISPEHIESHGSFEAYRVSKLELFRRLPVSAWAVLNREDPSSKLFAVGTRAQVVWYARSEIELRHVGHPVRVKSTSPHLIQMEVDSFFLESHLGGAFNVLNILAASATAMTLGVSISAIAHALVKFPGVPGRLEYIAKAPFAVVVDYANTPAAYEQVYATLGANLICVFGAAGGRDKWKRPELGRIASQYCKKIVLTSDDPDEEDPAAIASEILQGIPSNKLAIANIVLDRREAIRIALVDSKPGDAFILTGMGAQPWFIEKGKKIPWDDRAIVREELAKLDVKNLEFRRKYNSAR